VAGILRTNSDIGLVGEGSVLAGSPLGQFGRLGAQFGTFFVDRLFQPPASEYTSRCGSKISPTLLVVGLWITSSHRLWFSACLSRTRLVHC